MKKGLARLMKELRAQFDYVICDSPAGIERGAVLAMRHADEAVIVTNPKCRRCAIQIASSVCSTAKRRRQRKADGWRNICSSPALTKCGPGVATC